MSAAGFSAQLLDHGDPALVRSILDNLPEWFGIPEAVDTYVAEAVDLPMVRLVTEAAPIGFASLRQPFPETVELSCMAVHPRWHRKGGGRVLMEGILSAAKSLGARMLMVTTLGPSHPDPYYAATRQFYLRSGFLPLAEYPQIWGPEDPCLIMARPLGLPAAPH